MPATKRNPDWNGHDPKNDAEARELIVGAALKVAERDGLRKTNIKKIADELGITRQTVYRLFPSTEELLTHVTIATGGKILDRLMKAALQHDNFEDRVIESMVFLARHIPQDEFLRQYFSLPESNADNIGMSFSREGLEHAFQIQKALVPANTKMPDETWLKELAEHQQRILFGMIMAPSHRIKTASGMRDYLDKWLRPLLKPPQTARK